MLEFYFSYRGVLKRLRSGALGAEMDRIAEALSLARLQASVRQDLSRPYCAVQPFCCNALRFRCRSAQDRHRSLSAHALLRTLRGLRQ